MRSLRVFSLALLIILLLPIPVGGKDMQRIYVTGKLLDLAVQPVDRGTAVIGNIAAPIRGISYLSQIQVGDLVYFAQYNAGALSDRPNWVVNDPIDLRFEKEKMFLKRPDGKEVEAWLAKTVGEICMPKHYTPTSAAADVEAALRLLEGRWKLVILFHLFGGKVMRFSDLERAIPNITQKMLGQQLRSLASDGIVVRTAPSATEG